MTLKKTLLATFLLAFGFSPCTNAETFSLLADIHVTPGNENEAELKKVVEEINANDSKFVVLAGDLSNEGSDEQLQNIKSIFDNLKKPIYIVPGNHENNWSQSATKTFTDIWGDDRFVFESDSIIYIGINCGPYMKMGDGHIKQEDLIWLKKELSNRVKPGKKVISINHYPINSDLDNWQDYIAILQSFPTVAHLCGHYHTFRHYKGGDIDGFMCRALDMTKKGFAYGYTNVEVKSDSLFIYNKDLGKEQTLQFAIKMNDKHPEFEYAKVKESVMPKGYSIKRLYQDDASIFTRLAFDKDKIYFGNSLGEVKALNKADGKIFWSFTTNASLFSRPAVAGNYLIVPASDKRIIWCDKQTGRIIRENESAGPYVADGIIENGNLYQGGYKKFECWNTTTGNIKWSINDLNNYCQAAPTIDGNDIFFGAWDTYLRCVDKKTGKLKWKWNNGKSANMLGPGNCVPVVAGNRVFVVAPDRYMTALDKKTGEVIWRTNFDGKYKVRESLGISQDKKYVLAKTMDGELIAVRTDCTTPEPAFVVDAGFGYEHTPCIVAESKGIAYLGSKTGVLAAIDIKNKSLLWTYKLGSSAMNGFEIAKDGTIYTSLIDGSIWEIKPIK